MAVAKHVVLTVGLLLAAVAAQNDELTEASGPGTPILPQQPLRPDALCAATSCLVGTECRVLVPCDGCLPVATCVNPSQLPDDLDTRCLNARYLTTLIVADPPGPTPAFKALNCTPGSCPSGTVCAGLEAARDGDEGVCCTGKPDPLVSLEKPGFCPPMEDVGTCIAVASRQCEVDATCPGDLKCCPGPCGGSTCLPPVGDRCGGCPEDQECVNTGIMCITSPCPTWQCKPKVTVNPDRCGGCPPGKTCSQFGPFFACADSCDEMSTPQRDASCFPCPYHELCSPETKCAFYYTPCPSDSPRPCQQRVRSTCVSSDMDITCHGGCPGEEECVLEQPICPPFAKCAIFPVCKVVDIMGVVQN